MAQIYRVRAVGGVNLSGPCYANYYYGSGDGTAEEAKSAVGNFFNETKDLWSGVWTVEGDVALIDTVTDNILDVIPLDDDVIPGTKTGELLPTMTQLLLRFRTGQYRNGREVRGRSFLPGFTEDQNAASRPIAALVADIQGNANQWLRTGDGTTQQVVYSRGQAEAYAVQNSNVWSEWAVLRSRRQ